jgi:hypothetical protein
MAEPEFVVVYAATYPTAAAARAVLDTIEHLHSHEVAGKYDAAVIDKENGKPHVVKRMDHPRSRIIPEWFGRGALTREELNEAAGELLAGEAGLIVVGEATIEPALDKVFTGTARIVKREIEATIDQITSELQEAFKGLQAAHLRGMRHRFRETRTGRPRAPAGPAPGPFPGTIPLREGDHQYGPGV